MGERMIKTPELVEQVKTLHELGWSNVKIANHVNTDESNIRRWLKEDDPPETAGKLAKLRDKNVERFVEEAWDMVFKFNAVLNDFITNNPDKFRNPRDVATCMGIYVDKIAALQSRGGKSGGKSSININILPPSDGSPTRINANTVSVHDEPEQVPGDDSGHRSGENVLRLPPVSEDGPGISGEPWGDSS